MPHDKIKQFIWECRAMQTEEALGWTSYQQFRWIQQKLDRKRLWIACLSLVHPNLDLVRLVLEYASSPVVVVLKEHTTFMLFENPPP